MRARVAVKCSAKWKQTRYFSFSIHINKIEWNACGRSEHILFALRVFTVWYFIVHLLIDVEWALSRKKNCFDRFFFALANKLSFDTCVRFENSRKRHTHTYTYSIRYNTANIHFLFTTSSISTYTPNAFKSTRRFAIKLLFLIWKLHQ